jgi:hypothetical protein
VWGEVPDTVGPKQRERVNELPARQANVPPSNRVEDVEECPQGHEGLTASLVEVTVDAVDVCQVARSVLHGDESRDEEAGHHILHVCVCVCVCVWTSQHASKGASKAWKIECLKIRNGQANQPPNNVHAHTSPLAHTCVLMHTVLVLQEFRVWAASKASTQSTHLVKQGEVWNLGDGLCRDDLVSSASQHQRNRYRQSIGEVIRVDEHREERECGEEKRWAEGVDEKVARPSLNHNARVDVRVHVAS